MYCVASIMINVLNVNVNVESHSFESVPLILLYYIISFSAQVPVFRPFQFVLFFFLMQILGTLLLQFSS